MRDIVISPIFYMGNKKKLVQKGLTDLFPKKIVNYYEPFAGSSVVAMNVSARNYYINDVDFHLNELYDMFSTYSPDKIISAINERIILYGLPKERTKRNVYHDKSKIEMYKSAYIELRNHYNNSTHSVLDFYTLMLFSFSQQFRFNSKGEYNMPFGNDCFTKKNEGYIENGCNFFRNINVCHSNDSFDLFILSSDICSQSDVFVYFDPPYLSTTATYNESRGTEYTWNEAWEEKLRRLCEDLTRQGIKFAMSNVFANKNFINKSLEEWCERNKFSVYHFNHTYTSCGKGNAGTDEVLIMNYGGG